MKRRTIITTETHETWIFQDEEVEVLNGRESNNKNYPLLPPTNEGETSTQPQVEDQK